MKIVLLPTDRMFTENMQNTNEQQEPESMNLVITAADGRQWENVCVISFDGFTITFETYTFDEKTRQEITSPEQRINVTDLRSLTINA